jgi:uncharacterized protein YoxC
MLDVAMFVVAVALIGLAVLLIRRENERMVFETLRYVEAYRKERVS